MPEQIIFKIIDKSGLINLLKDINKRANSLVLDGYKVACYKESLNTLIDILEESK